MIVKNAASLLRTKNYTDDNQAGRDYADALHFAVLQGLSAPDFGAALRTMIECGAYGGFEVGFAFRMHELLRASAIRPPSG